MLNHKSFKITIICFFCVIYFIDAVRFRAYYYQLLKTRCCTVEVFLLFLWFVCSSCKHIRLIWIYWNGLIVTYFSYLYALFSCQHLTLISFLIQIIFKLTVPNLRKLKISCLGTLNVTLTRHWHVDSCSHLFNEYWK